MSNENQKKADNKLYNAFRLLEKNNILYYEVLKRINYIVDPKFHLSIAGIGYDPSSKKVYMILNENALIEGSVEDVAGLIEHECGHSIYEHIMLEKNSSKDPRTLNMAQDYIINESGQYLGKRYEEIKDPKNNSILAKGCFFKDIEPIYPELKGKTGNDFTSNQLYDILIKNEDNQNQNKDSNGQSGGKNNKLKQEQGKGQESNQSEQGESSRSEGFDEHGVLEVSEKEDGSLEIKGKINDTQAQELSNEIKSVIRESIEKLKRDNQLAKGIGQVGGQIGLILTEMIKTRTDKNAVIDFVAKIDSEEKKTFFKLNKRYPYLARGRRMKKQPIVVVGCDTSGSMGGETFFKMILDQIEKVKSICKEVHVVCGDVGLCSVVLIDDLKNFDPTKINFKGGSGTNLQFIWDYAESIEADGVLVHTDGEIPAFDDKTIDTMFFTYGEGNISSQIESYQHVKVYAE